MDVDGTLTDGKINMSENGELFKTFDIKDGCGIKDILPKYEIIPVIITARESKILKLRCDELGITHLYQGVRFKLSKLQSMLSDYNKKNKTNFGLKNCAYIGDDILDLQCMKPIKEAGGIVGCPSDASKKVFENSDYIATHKGGNGAVREFIEWILNSLDADIENGTNS